MSCRRTRRRVGDKRFQFFRRNFSQLSEVLAEAGVQAVRGVLFDLGFSSLQLACAERGFSFQRTGDLDMRLDRRQGLTVCQWLRQADEKDIARVLKEYGEEPRHGVWRAHWRQGAGIFIIPPTFQGWSLKPSFARHPDAIRRLVFFKHCESPLTKSWIIC